MRHTGTLAAACLAAIAMTAGAQEPLPRSWVASPGVYKLLAQGEPFVVVEVTWKPGQKDAMHSHPASAVYFLNDCTLRNTFANGKTVDTKPKAGAAVIQPAIPGHFVENVGSADCRLIMFEPAK